MARAAATVEAALDAIITIDHEGRVMEFNPAAEKTFGYARDQATGRPLTDLVIPPALRERHRAGLARYLARGESEILGRRVELTAMRSDGSEFPVELTVVPIRRGDQAIFTSFVRDITERKRAEAEREELLAMLQGADPIDCSGRVDGPPVQRVPPLVSHPCVRHLEGRGRDDPAGGLRGYTSYPRHCGAGKESS